MENEGEEDPENAEPSKKKKYNKQEPKEQPKKKSSIEQLVSYLKERDRHLLELKKKTGASATINILLYYNNRLYASVEEISGFTNQAYNPRPQAEGCMRDL